MCYQKKKDNEIKKTIITTWQVSGRVIKKSKIEERNNKIKLHLRFVRKNYCSNE